MRAVTPRHFRNCGGDACLLATGRVIGHCADDAGSAGHDPKRTMEQKIAQLSNLTIVENRRDTREGAQLLRAAAI